MASQFDDFLHHAEPNLARACSARVATVALASGDHLTSLLTSVAVGPAPAFAHLREAHELKVADAVVMTRVIAPEHVRALLAAAGSGIIGPDLLSTALPLHVGYLEEPTKSGFSLSSFLEPRTPRVKAYDLAFGAYECVSETDQISGVLDWRRDDALRRSLPACDLPARDVYDLASCFGIPRSQSQYRRIALLTPTWVRLSRVEPNASHTAVEVDVQTYWSDGLSDSEIAAIPNDSGGTGARFKVPLTHRKPLAGEDPHAMYGHASVPWPSTAGPVSIVLLHEGQRVDSVLAGVANPRVRVHSFFDPGCTLLRKQLAPATRPDRAHFEKGVAALLHLCGFSVEHLGGGKVEKEIDLVAFIEDDPVLFLECTTEPPSSDKLAHCASRSAECLKTLGATPGRGCVAIATPTQSPTADDCRRANELGIALLGARDLSAFLEMAERSESARSVLDFIRQRSWGLH